MDNYQLYINLNYLEIVLIFVVLVYSFYFSEKKYFNKLVLSVINKILVLFRGVIRHKKLEDK